MIRRGTFAVGLALLLAGMAASNAVGAPKPGQLDGLKTPLGKSGFRKLAPGVETTIPILRSEEETHDVHNVVELVPGVPNLKWTPYDVSLSKTLHSKAQKVTFRRPIWNLEFTFKPMRMIWVDVPQPNGKLQRKLIWYLVYRVKNSGRHMKPVRQAKGSYKVQLDDNVGNVANNTRLHFFPHFVLESHEFNNKGYLDRLVPTAIGPIQKREDPKRRLLNSVQMSRISIPISTKREDNSVWGVATWENVDPKIDFFSVYIRGLTNAYRWKDRPELVKPGVPPGTGRSYKRRTLRLNFWRPGDQFLQHEKEFRFGIPGKVDHEWVWR